MFRFSIPGPPAVGCSLLRAQLGYLISASRIDLGGFSLSCSGCYCHRSVAYHDPVQNPWPELQTYAALAHDVTYWETNISVTALTSFYVVWDSLNQTSCELSIKHVPPSTQHIRRGHSVPASVLKHFANVSSLTSRIRIDSFSVKEANEELAVLIKKARGQLARESIFCGAGPPPLPPHPPPLPSKQKSPPSPLLHLGRPHLVASTTSEKMEVSHGR